MTPTYIFPAMNTFMYEHPLTAEHLRIIRDVIKYHVVGPIDKVLACGDIGGGVTLLILQMLMLTCSEKVQAP